MWPFVSKMTLEPCPLPELPVTEMATTLGETTPAVAAQLGAAALACRTGAGEVAIETTPAVAAGDVMSVRVRAYVPALARTENVTGLSPRLASFTCSQTCI
jgi:hypothetical protein